MNMDRYKSERFEDRLLEELRAVVAEGSPPPAAQLDREEQSLGLRRRIAGARPSRLLAIGAACLAFAGTAMAATGVWDPGIGTDADHGPLTVSRSPVPSALTAVLEVLRRPPQARDRSAEVEATLRGAGIGDGVRPDSVRYLAPGVDGEATIVLSAKHVRPFIAEGEPVCIFRPLEGFAEPSPACFGLPQLLAGEALAEASGPGNPPTAFGLVPDGVATVTAEFGGAPDRTVQVANNYFELPLSGSDSARLGIERIVWRDADGNVVPQEKAASGGP